MIGRLEEAMGDGRLRFQAAPLVITSNGSRIFFGNQARVWTVGELTSRAVIESSDAGRVVGLTEEGAVALTAPSDRELLVIEVATGRQIGRLLNSREFSCLALAHDGCVVATGDYEHDIKLWDLTRVESQLPEWQRRGSVSSVAICDDPTLAVLTIDDTHELWNTVTGAPLEDQAIVASRRIVRRSMPLLDPRIKQEVRARIKQSLRVRANEITNSLEIPLRVMAFSLSAGRAVSAPGYRTKSADVEEPPYDHPEVDRGYSLQLWDLENTRHPRSLRGHTMSVTCADITDNGKRALSGSRGRVLRLWDLDAGVCLQVLRGHRGIVLACAISDDARLALSGSEDMTVRLWDLTQGKLLFTFASSSMVTACDIARDCSVAIAAEVSGRVHTFSIDGLA
jgi:WD40 repeat protein